MKVVISDILLLFGMLLIGLAFMGSNKAVNPEIDEIESCSSKRRKRVKKVIKTMVV